jgi:hypothetical protein
MRIFVAVILALLACIGWAAETPPAPQPASVKGEVLEVKDVDTYTYLRLKTKDGETWAAVNKAPISKGAEVTIENATVMTNFESKTLKKTFDRIVFGTLAGTGSTANPPARVDMAQMHAGVSKPTDAGNVKVPKAKGPDARTVAEIVEKRAALNNKPVLVRGKVVKYTAGVMGKNWIHLRDGTGSPADNTNDVLVTTLDETKIGDVVVARGTVRTDVDLGSGYFYAVLVDEAKLQK